MVLWLFLVDVYSGCMVGVWFDNVVEVVVGVCCL